MTRKCEQAGYLDKTPSEQKNSEMKNLEMFPQNHESTKKTHHATTSQRTDIPDDFRRCENFTENR